MEVVLGIGGLFFRARNPQSLAAWYREHLGIAVVPANYDDPVWQQQAGPTAFAPFEESTSYFGPGEKQWMVNFRVRSLEAMVAQLRAAGIAVEIDPQHYPKGRFPRLHDPEGKPLKMPQPTPHVTDRVRGSAYAASRTGTAAPSSGTNP